MINLKERLENRSQTESPPGAPAPLEQPGSAPGFDEAQESVEPTAGIYLARRAVVVAAMALLVAIGAIGGGRFLSGEVPLASLTVAPDQATQATMLPAENVPPPPPPSPSTTEPPTTEAPTTETAPAPAEQLPEGSSRLVPLDPSRILDTGEESTVDRTFRIELEQEWVAAALSVTVMGPTEAGSVLVDGGSGAVEAVRLDRPGQATTNLVVVPVVGRTLTVRSTSNGRVTIDLVGVFEASGATEAGRFVATEPVEVADLVTAEDGRETTLSFDAGAPIDQAAAFLVAIEADVGDDGGTVRLGPDPESFDQMVMWGPGDDGIRQRRGLVLVRPNELGDAHLRYEGGSELSAHVVGYFTNGGQPAAAAGLYVPVGPRRIHEGVLRPGQPVVVDGVEPPSGTGLVTVSSASIESGRLGTYLIPVDDGRINLNPSTEVDSIVNLLGVFIGEVR